MANTNWSITRVVKNATGNVTLSAMEIWDKVTNLSAGATVTSTYPPIAGDVSALVDGDPNTSCTFDEATLRKLDFAINYTLAAAAEPLSVRIAVPGETHNLKHLSLFEGHDAQGVPIHTYSDFIFTGANILSPLQTQVMFWGRLTHEIFPLSSYRISGTYGKGLAIAKGGEWVFFTNNSSSGRIHMSTDYGVTYSVVGPIAETRHFGPIAASEDGQLIIAGAGTSSAPFVVSRDFGSTWTSFNIGSGAGGHNAVAISQNKQYVAVITGGSNTSSASHMVHISVDGGVSFNTVSLGVIPNGSTTGWLDCAVTNTGVVYATWAYAGPRLYRFTDGGANWSYIELPVENPQPGGVGVSPDGVHIYVGTYGSGATPLVSHDAGVSWTPIGDTKITNLNMARLLVDDTGMKALFSHSTGGYFVLVTEGGAKYHFYRPDPGSGYGYIGMAATPDFSKLFVVQQGTSTNGIIHGIQPPLNAYNSVNTHVGQFQFLEGELDEVYDPYTQREVDGYSYYGTETIALHGYTQRIRGASNSFGRVYGTVSKLVDSAQIPWSRKLRLYDHFTGELVATGESNPDGSYEFTGLNPNYEYDVVAHDHELNYRSVIANNLKPEV